LQVGQRKVKGKRELVGIIGVGPNKDVWCCGMLVTRVKENCELYDRKATHDRNLAVGGNGKDI